MFHRSLPAPRAGLWANWLVLVLLLCACTSQVELISQITEGQANDVIAALADQGIQAEKILGKEGMVALRVSQDQVAHAIDILHSQGLPREPYASMGDVFKKDGLISSPTEERARMVFALSQELSNTISKIDGVIYAQVHVVLPDRGGFGESGIPSSAAVFIKYEDTTSLDDVVPQIRRLVANSIPGLSFEKVSVELVPSAIRTATHAPTPGRLDSVWGIRVDPASAPWLRALLGGLGVAVFAACAGLGFLLVRRAQRKNGEAAHG